MERTIGIGGIFFKANDPDGLQKWYENHLGPKPDPDGCEVFRWRERDEAFRKASTVWAPFPADTKHFGNGSQTAMVNYRVKNIDAMLAQLRSAKAMVDDEIDESEGGRFPWLGNGSGR